jgi:transglutaminase-like putative cysteine protease
MKNTLCAGVLVPLLFAMAVPLSAKEFLSVENIAALSQQATTEKYPDSDDVQLDDFTQVQYQPDGTSETWVDTAIKILTEKGKRNHRTQTLHFNVSYGTSDFTLVQVLKPDGSVHEVDIEAQSKVMVNPSQMSANIYNPNSKVLKLSVPGLEVGDTLRYVIHRVRSKTVVPDTWSDYQVFEHTSPIERMTYQVIAPKERPLVKMVHKDEVAGTVSFSETQSEQSDQIVYTWEVRDVPRMFDEPNMPTRHTVVQRLLVSTIEEWEDLSKWYWELCRPRLEATTPEMETKAWELTAGCTNTTEKIRAIFNFVSQDIRYMGITTEEEAPGYEPHDVKTTFENRYGVCRDKAALLVSMLRLVDIEAFPVIIMAGPKKDEEVPQPFFNHAVTAALDDTGEYVLMDSTDENTKDIFPSYLQNMSYIVARPEGDTLRTSPVIPADDNLLRVTSTGRLDPAGNLHAESSLIFEGINDTVYRGLFSKIKPEERKRFFEGHIKRSMPTAELQKLEILPVELRDTTQPLTIKLVYTADNLLIEGEKNKMLDLPRLGSSLGYANFLIGQTGLEERKYPLFTRITAGIRETLELQLPADIGTLNIPGYESIDSAPLSWDMQVAQAGNTLSATNTFLMHTVEFSPAEYLVLKQNLKDIEYNLRKKLILDASAEDRGTSPDVRILNSGNEIVLEDAQHWKQTIRTQTEILTYAGKKKHSEIKLPYNPAWQQIELTKATVTQPDGTVKEISEEEINIMDAGWAAAAPRYPAEKILVANLPGVEIGSILDVEFVSTVNGKPFFSVTETFNAYEPIERKTVTLTAPESLELNILNTGIDETKTASVGTLSYTWTAENQAAVKKEEALPAWWTFNPAVFVSTSTWETYGHTVHEQLIAATTNQPQTRVLAENLTHGTERETEKVVALRNWVAENLRPAGPSITSLPLSAITAADQTLDDRYGNNTDRMVVLYTLLQHAGLNPQFILSGNISLIKEEADPLLGVPSRTAFNTVLIEVEVEGETIYLSGATQYAEPGTTRYDRRPMLNLATGTVGTVRATPGKQFSTHTLYEMSIGENGETGIRVQTAMKGTLFEDFHKRYAEMTPEKRRRHFLELVSQLSQSAKAVSELKTHYSDYPGTLEYSAVAERYAVLDGDHLYFTIPGSPGGLLKYRSNERTLPLAWSGYVDSAVEYNIILPDGYEPSILPKNLSWQAPKGGGLIEISVEYSKLANAVRIVQIADLNPALIPAEDFPKIIETSRTLAHPSMRTILLKKKD